MSANPYRVLKVSPDAGQDEIRAAYLKLLRSHPPETQPEEFKAIRAAYERLKDEDERIRTAVLEMDLTDPEPALPFPAVDSPPPCFAPEDLAAILTAAGEFGRRDFPEDIAAIDEEGVRHDV